MNNINNHTDFDLYSTFTGEKINNGTSSNTSSGEGGGSSGATTTTTKNIPQFLKIEDRTNTTPTTTTQPKSVATAAIGNNVNTNTINFQPLASIRLNSSSLASTSNHREEEEEEEVEEEEEEEFEIKRITPRDYNNSGRGLLNSSILQSSDSLVNSTLPKSTTPISTTLITSSSLPSTPSLISNSNNNNNSLIKPSAKWKFASSPGKTRPLSVYKPIQGSPSVSSYPKPTFCLDKEAQLIPDYTNNNNSSSSSSPIVVLQGPRSSVIEIQNNSNSNNSSGNEQEEQQQIYSNSLPASMFHKHHNHNTSHTNDESESHLSSSVLTSSNGTPMLSRKSTLIDKVKYIFSPDLTQNGGQLFQDTPQQKEQQTTATNQLPPSQQPQQQSNPTTNTKDKFTINIFKIFEFPTTETIISEHPCAYRRKVSKAGKLYITDNYFCFYSLIFNKEIKKFAHFKDVLTIRKVSSIIIGQSIEISTIYKKYMFGVFENTEVAYQALTNQLSQYKSLTEQRNKSSINTSSVSVISDQKKRSRFFSISTTVSQPVNSNSNSNNSDKKKLSSSTSTYNLNLKKINDSSEDALVAPQTARANVTFSVENNSNNDGKDSGKDNDSESSNNSNNSTPSNVTPQQSSPITIIKSHSIMRTRSGSLPSYSTKKSSKLNYLISPQKNLDKLESTSPSENEITPPSSVGSGSNGDSNPNTTTTTTSTATATKPIISHRKNNSAHKSITFSPNILANLFNLNNMYEASSTTPNSSSPATASQMTAVDNEKDSSTVNTNSIPNSLANSVDSLVSNSSISSTPSSSTPPVVQPQQQQQPLTPTRDRSFTTSFNPFSKSKNKNFNKSHNDSFDRINKMLITRASRDDVQQYCFKEDVFGIPLESMRMAEDSHCPVFVCKLVNHLETTHDSIESIYLTTSCSSANTSQSILSDGSISISNGGGLSSSNLYEGVSRLDQLAKMIKRGKEDIYKHMDDMIDSPLLGQLLKLFLNKLPTPLLNDGLLCESLRSIINPSEQHYKLSFVRSIIFSQPQANWSVFKLLLQHFRNLAKIEFYPITSDDNNNNNDNSQPFEITNQIDLLFHRISTIFGPILFKINNNASVQQNDNSIEIFYYILIHFNEIFNDNDDSTQYIVKKGNQVLKNGTVSQIILKLLDIHYKDETLLETFNLTHHDYFLPTESYIALLVNRYTNLVSQHPTSITSSTGIAVNDISNEWRIKVRERILFIIRSLIEFKPMFWSNIHECFSSVELIQTFSDKFISKHTTTAEELKYFQYLLDLSTKIIDTGNAPNALSMSADSISVMNLHNGHAPAPSAFSPPQSPTGNSHQPMLGASRIQDMKKFNIIDMDATQIAIQITLIDEKSFRMIPVFELLKKKFTNPDLSPNYQNMVKLFNRWSAFVGSEILNHSTPGQRAAVIEKFIEIAIALKSLKNFHGCYSITQGIYHYSIKRLYLTWDKVSKKSMALFQELQNLFSTESNHKVYREMLHASSPPLIPYLGLYTKDLLVSEDSNPTFLIPKSPSSVIGEEKEQIINLEKMRSIYQVIKNWKLYRVNPYPMKTNPIQRDKIISRNILNDDELFEKSLLIEPRIRGQTTAALNPPLVNWSNTPLSS
ncbi:hypothetical protein CYY_000720 [Polysphondylium violaceum]|uniref:RasGEF domain-containing protein n=1 Tax=Polysphondylium violaceum TaxID=133409 RepID=A0A8J4QAJ8_9MYCE|nr:hypothetical protein CYY_000720 [Polysphondylium violaceum]